MYVGMAVFDLLLGDVRSVKDKRSVVRPIVAEVRRRFPVAVAETGHLDLYRRAEIGVAVVSGEPAHTSQVLDAIERWMAGRPEVELVSAHRQLRSSDDE
jgi:uncharacterized protein